MAFFTPWVNYCFWNVWAIKDRLKSRSVCLVLAERTHGSTEKATIHCCATRLQFYGCGTPEFQNVSYVHCQWYWVLLHISIQFAATLDTSCNSYTFFQPRHFCLLWQSSYWSYISWNRLHWQRAKLGFTALCTCEWPLDMSHTYTFPCWPINLATTRQENSCFITVSAEHRAEMLCVTSIWG